MGFQTSNDSEHRPIVDINITPMVDVMLVLLVIFMITTPLMENGIPIQLPKADATALPKQEAQMPVTLTITKDKKLYILKQEVRYGDLEAHLKGLFESRPNKEIFIRAATDLPYGVVAATMALVKKAGIHKIGLATVPLGE